MSMRILFLIVLAMAPHAFGQSALDDAKAKAKAGREEIVRAETMRRENDGDEVREVEQNAVRLISEARRAYESAHVLDSKDVEAIADFANLYELTNDHDLAAEAYERAMALAPESAEYALKAGLALARLGEPGAKGALAHFDRALKLSDAAAVVAPAEAGRGDVYWKLEYYGFALEAYEAALAVEEENVRARLGKAVCLARRGDVSEAAALFDGLGALPPDATFLSKELLQSALGDFQRDRMWFTDTAAHHLDYAKLLLRADRMPESMLAISRSVALDDSNYVAWNMLGSVAIQLGQRERAVEAFETSLKVNPDQERTRQTLDAIRKAAEAEAQRSQQPENYVTRPAPETPQTP